MKEQQENELLRLIEPGYVLALIPARGGSKSVPKKNIRLFKGHPLIAYSIAACALSEKTQRVVVSTDSEAIRDIALSYGAEAPFLRPAEYAGDLSPDIDFMKHAIRWFGENEKRIPQYILHIRPTTPIRDYRLLDRGVELIEADGTATSLRSGYILAHMPYKWYRFGENGYMRPLFDGMTCDEVNLPRQDFPRVFVPNSYVDVVKPEFILKTGLLHGERMIGLETEEVPDIDTEEDLYKLEVYRGHKEYLRELFDWCEGSRASQKSVPE